MDAALNTTPPSPSGLFERGGGIFGGSGSNATDINSNSSVSSLYASLTTNVILGSLCLVTFLVLRTFQSQYWLRELLPYVTVKPPKLPHKFPGNVFGWLKPCFAATDNKVLKSAGLDALVLQKSMALGMQLLFPLSVLGLSVLLPLNIHSGYIVGDQTFGQLTMANVTTASGVLWVHWVMVLVFLVWAVVLMDWHYKQFVSVRQHYLKGGDDPNYWRELHMAEADGVLVHRHAKMVDVVAQLKYKKLMDALDEEEEQKKRKMHILKRVMLWLTKWLETEDPSKASRHRKSSTQGEWENVAENIIQGDYIRDMAHPEHEAAHAVPQEQVPGARGGVQQGDVYLNVEAGSPSSGAGNGAHAVAAAVPQQAAAVPQQEVAAAGTAPANVQGPNGAGGSGKGAALGSEVVQNKSARKDEFKRAIVGEDTGSKVAPKWWSKVDAVATAGGLQRKVHSAELQDQAASVIMLAKPSVRYLKTINTFNGMGKRVAVNAQQYAVLVTNVSRVCYPELLPARSPAKGGKPFKQTLDPDVAAEEGKASVVAASLPAAPHVPGRGWALVRQAMKSGRVRALLSDPNYSMVSAVFSSLFPEDFDQVVPVFNHRTVDLLMRKWDMRLGQLEDARHRFSITKAVPMLKVGGRCCFGKQQVEAIPWLEREVSELETAIVAERKRVMTSAFTPSWFVLFRTQKAAAIAASCNIHPLNQEVFQVHAAPGPEEVNWQALWYNAAQRKIRAVVVAPFIILLVLFPISLLSSAISQLNTALCDDTSVTRWDWYCDRDSIIAAALKALLTGFLPSLLVLIWQSMALPRLIFLCAQSEGRHMSLSALDRRMAEVYFYWDVFAMFAQGIVGGTIILKIQQYINDPTSIPMVLGEAVPVASKFFVIYLVMRALLTVPLRFLITQPGVWQSWLRIFDAFSKNPSERTWYMRHTIVSPRYGVEYGNITLILLISLSLSVVCPIVLPFACLFFAGMWLFWRYQLLYNYARKYESGGLMWPYLMNRILICLEIMVLFTGCVLIVKRAFAQATILWLLGSAIVLATYRRWQAHYVKGITAMPLLLAQSAPRARVPPSIYVPPPLLDNGMGWYPEWNKVWAFFGMPGYSP